MKWEELHPPGNRWLWLWRHITFRKEFWYSGKNCKNALKSWTNVRPCSSTWSDSFLDAIASPSTYPCQSVGQWPVGHWQFQIGNSYRISELCELVNFWGILNLYDLDFPLILNPFTGGENPEGGGERFVCLLCVCNRYVFSWDVWVLLRERAAEHLPDLHKSLHRSWQRISLVSDSLILVVWWFNGHKSIL